MLYDPKDAQKVTCRNSRGGLKNSFSSKQEAKIELKRKLKTHGISKAYMRIYECQYHGWHIGHAMNRNSILD